LPYFAAFQKLNTGLKEAGQTAFSRIVVFVDDQDLRPPASAYTVLWIQELFSTCPGSCSWWG